MKTGDHMSLLFVMLGGLLLAPIVFPAERGTQHAPSARLNKLNVAALDAQGQPVTELILLCFQDETKHGTIGAWQGLFGSIRNKQLIRVHPRPSVANFQVPFMRFPLPAWN